MTIHVNTKDILLNGKPVGIEQEKGIIEIMKRIEKQGTGQGYGFADYTFDRGITGWKPERTMRLGLEMQKYLYKAKAEETAPHIVIDIPAEGENNKYMTFYRGPDLEIDEGGQNVKITGLAHLTHEQLGNFVEEASKVYCQVMEVDYDKEAKEQL
jgi:hypothetical protein